VFYVKFVNNFRFNLRILFVVSQEKSNFFFFVFDPYQGHTSYIWYSCIYSRFYL